MRQRNLRVVVAVVLLALAGCDDDRSSDENTSPATVTGSFVGTVDGSDAYAAVVIGPEGSAMALVTDGASSVDLMFGTLTGERVRLENDGGAVLETTVDGSRASGTFTRPDEPPLAFTAEAADAPAGLYQAFETFADGEYVAGWVVLPDGTQRGSVRRYETPLAPGEVDMTAFSVDNPVVDTPGGTLTLTRVDPAVFGVDDS